MKKLNKGFTVIEIIVGVLVFTIGITAVFLMISNALNITAFNRDYIIASNLGREQIEMVRNIRDTNFRNNAFWNLANIKDYDKLNISSENPEKLEFTAGKKYILNNDFSSTANYPIKISETSISDISNVTELLPSKLCINSENIYVTCSAGLEETKFYRFVEFSKIATSASSFLDENEGLKMTSYVFWEGARLNSYKIETLILNYK